MITPSRAARAAAHLRNKLSNQWWLTNVDFVSGNDGYVVKVRVSRLACDVSAIVPREFDGVPVELAAAG